MRYNCFSPPNQNKWVTRGSHILSNILREKAKRCNIDCIIESCESRQHLKTIDLRDGGRGHPVMHHSRYFALARDGFELFSIIPKIRRKISEVENNLRLPPKKQEMIFSSNGLLPCKGQKSTLLKSFTLLTKESDLWLT